MSFTAILFFLTRIRADKTNLAKFNVGNTNSKAHPLYTSIGSYASFDCLIVVFCDLKRCRQNESCNAFWTFLTSLAAATLPSSIRQSQTGAQVTGLVPIYMRHLMPATLTPDDHALNSKRILWAALERILAPLIPERMDDPETCFVDGFRSVVILFIGHCLLAFLAISCPSWLLVMVLQQLLLDKHVVFLSPLRHSMCVGMLTHAMLRSAVAARSKAQRFSLVFLSFLEVSSEVLHGVVAVDALQHDRKNQIVVERIDAAPAVARTCTRHGDQAAHTLRLHRIHQNAR